MNVFIHEGRSKLRSFLLWVFFTGLLLVLFMSLLPSFQDESSGFLKVLESYPEELLRISGIDISLLSRSSGFVAFTYNYIQLMLAIMGILWGLTLIGREKLSRMNDFLLVKPYSRLFIILQKHAVGLIGIFAINAFIWLLFILFRNFFDIDAKSIVDIQAFIASGLLIQLFMYSLGAALATILKKIKNPVGFATAVSFAFYMLLLLSRLMEHSLLTNMTPFGLLEPSKILLQGLTHKTIIGFICCTFVLTVISVFFYCRMDAEA